MMRPTVHISLSLSHQDEIWATADAEGERRAQVDIPNKWIAFSLTQDANRITDIQKNPRRHATSKAANNAEPAR